ncbi:hypothetical protein D3C81_2031630 [compost metagenome]
MHPGLVCELHRDLAIELVGAADAISHHATLPEAGDAPAVQLVDDRVLQAFHGDAAPEVCASADCVLEGIAVGFAVELRGLGRV